MWKTVNVEGEQAGLTLDEAELTAGSGTHQFTLSNQNLWPLGVYAVEIYLNHELQQTLEFRVE